MKHEAIPLPAIAGIIDLARKWSRAIERGKGIRLEADQMDMLTAIGANDVLQAAAAELLKEQARCRDVQRRRESISAVPIGSIGTARQMEASDHHTSPSSGMTQTEDAFALLEHAQRITMPPSKR
jgi:hypothetical protein